MPKISENASSRTRSPAYPSISLKKAVERAKQLYDHERRNLVHVDVAMGHWGYDPKSGIGLRAIAALKQFGLLAEDGKKDDRQVKLTPLAINIIMPDEPDGDSFYRDLVTAALLPKIHKELWEHYNGELPSDAALSSYLIKTKNFNDDFVGRFISHFRATISFAKLSREDTIEGEDGENVSGDDGGVRRTQEASKRTIEKEKEVLALLEHNSSSVVRDFPIPLISGGVAVVKVPVPMSESDFEQITGTLAAWKTALVKKSPPTAGKSSEAKEDELSDG